MNLNLFFSFRQIKTKLNICRHGLELTRGGGGVMSSTFDLYVSGGERA